MRVGEKVIIADTGELGRIMGFDGVMVVIVVANGAYRVRRRVGVQSLTRWESVSAGLRFGMQKVGVVISAVLDRTGNLLISAVVVALLPLDWPGLY